MLRMIVFRFDWNIQPILDRLRVVLAGVASALGPLPSIPDVSDFVIGLGTLSGSRSGKLPVVVELRAVRYPGASRPTRAAPETRRAAWSTSLRAWA